MLTKTDVVACGEIGCYKKLFICNVFVELTSLKKSFVRSRQTESYFFLL